MKCHQMFNRQLQECYECLIGNPQEILARDQHKMAAVPAGDMSLKEMDSPNPAMAGDGIVTSNIVSSTSPVSNPASVATEGLHAGARQCDAVMDDVGSMVVLSDGARLCPSQGRVDSNGAASGIPDAHRDRADGEHPGAEDSVGAVSYTSVIGAGGVAGSVVGTPVPVGGMVGVGDSDKANSDSSKRRRTWTDDEKIQHKSACKGKGKLTLGQKMEIVRRHETSDPEDHKTQAQLASMFGKSRSAISKILRPGNIAKLKHTYSSGVNPAVKRFFAAEHPELDKKIHHFIDNARRNCDASSKRGYPGMGAVCRSAENFAREMGIMDFKASNGWYSRFIKRYGLSTRAGGNPQPEVASESDVGLFRHGASMAHQGIEQAAPVHARSHLTRSNVTIKVSLQPRDGGDVVNRRLQVPLDLDPQRIPLNGYETVMGMVQNAFKSELQPGVQPRLGYKDEESDDIVVSSDHELGVALMQQPPIRLYLSQVQHGF